MKRILVWVCLLGGGTAMALALHIQSIDWLGSNRVRLAWGSAGGAGTAVWGNPSLQSQFANWAVAGGCPCGMDGNQQDGARCELRCLRLSDGQVVWACERFGFGNWTLVEDRLLVLSARGELVLVVPSPAGYREARRTQILGGECWTAPLVSGRHIFARNKQGTLVRVDLP